MFHECPSQNMKACLWMHKFSFKCQRGIEWRFYLSFAKKKIMRLFFFCFFFSCCMTSPMSCALTSPCTWTKTSCSCPFSSTPAEGVCAPSPCTSRPPSAPQESTFSGTGTLCRPTTSSARVPWRSWRTARSRPFWVGSHHLRSVSRFGASG